MADNKLSRSRLLKVHIIGAVVCASIAGSAIYFAAGSITKRRVIFVSARSEYANTKSQANKALSQRMAFTSQVQDLEKGTLNQLQLVSGKQLNTRTAEIVSLAESVNIRLDSLQPLDMITDKRVPVQPLELRGSSRADHAIEFLSLLSDQMPDIHVQTIDLVKDSVESSSVHITMQLYWFVNPADVSQ